MITDLSLLNTRVTKDEYNKRLRNLKHAEFNRYGYLQKFAMSGYRVRYALRRYKSLW